MKDIRIVVAGGRDFNVYDCVKITLDNYISQIRITKLYKDLPFEEFIDKVEIVSGGAKGADSLGEQYALEQGLTCTVFNADWDTHGKSAGYIRNSEMAKYGTHAVIFWDGESKGSGHMIDLAKKHKVKTTIIPY